MARAFTFMTMTKYYVVIFSLCCLSSFAQESMFPINEIGRYEFSEVVQMGGMKKDKLFDNGKKFMKKVKVLNSKKKFYSEDAQAYSLKNRGSFYVYRMGSMKKAIAGAVEYDLTLEVKEARYRYTLTNFVFNEYKKNRYAKYEPIKGKYTPLEAQLTGVNAKEWEKQKQVVYDKSQELIQNLYSDMLFVESNKKKKKKKEENW